MSAKRRRVPTQRAMNTMSIVVVLYGGTCDAPDGGNASFGKLKLMFEP